MKGSTVESLLLWSALLALLAMGLSGCSAAPTPTVVSAPQPSATEVPTPQLGQWQLSGDYVTQEAGPACARALPEGAFILGGDSATCEATAMGGSAVTTLDVPAADGRQVVVLRLNCTAPGGCAESVSARGPGEVSLAVDGQTLWRVKCEESGSCDRMALGNSPTIAIVSEAPAEHQIRFTASPYTSLPIADVSVDWIPLPDTTLGIAYSPFRDCQNPHWGPYPTEDQIREDLLMVQHMGNAIRTYSSTGIQGRIPELANERGLRVSAGAWLDKDDETNVEQITALIELARTAELESVIVGNEVLLRGDLSEDELINYIQWVKSEVDVPVTTAEVAHVLLNHPRVMDAVDYHMVHIYAFWDSIPIENAARYTADVYDEFLAQAGGKRVVIGETGWPSGGPANGGAIPSPENQRRFMREFLTVAQQEGIELYYFDAFDELWKMAERGVGTYWGFMYSDRTNKYDLQSLLIPLDDVPGPRVEVAPVPTGTPGPTMATGDVFPVFLDYAAVFRSDESENNHFAPSGWMGDLAAISFNDCARLGEEWTGRVTEIQYTPGPADNEGWAGIYWQYPENNWGTSADPYGYDLSDYTQLRFLARSEVEGSQVKFFTGGISTGPYPSSIPEPIFAEEADGQGFVTLSTEWQEFHIGLEGADLSHVIDGFGWVAERARTPEGVILFLDDILFDREPAPFLAEPVYVGPTLGYGYDMGVDSSGHRHDWVTDMDGSMRLDYPAGQSWGAVFITVGEPAPQGRREARDLSTYDTLLVELRGENGGEVVSLGVKDTADPDDGSGTTVRLTLTEDWQTYELPLSDFATADLTRIYIPLEVVFEPDVASETIYFRNVRYLEER